MSWNAPRPAPLSTPAVSRSVVTGARLDPTRAFWSHLFLPERGARFQIIHQKFARLERFSAVRTGDNDKYDLLERLERAELHQEECDALTRQYLDSLSKYSTDARYVTDKMPQNFLYLGIIELLFPQAHVIHCIRDPLDNCLSCFFQNFGATHSYTYDLESLGRYYKEYQRLMQHWHAVLNISMLDVHYEALVSDPENVTRSLLEFCDLEWDDRCLRFYENERIVNTLSHEQVRLPVYTRSVGRWKHYEPYIQPLIDYLKQ